MPDPNHLQSPDANKIHTLTGEQRRHDILQSLHDALRARRRRRAAIRLGAGTLSMAAVVLTVVLVMRPSIPPHNAEQLVTLPDAPPPAATPDLVEPPANETLPARATLTIRHSVPVTLTPCDGSAVRAAVSASAQPGSSVCLASDDQLLAILAETGERFGLVRRAGRVEIVRNAP